MQAHDKPTIRLTVLLLFAAALAVAPLCQSVSARKAPRSSASYEELARKRKADYLFMESKRLNLAGRYDEYYTALRRAYLLDTTDIEVARELGLCEWQISQSIGDTSLRDSGVARMRAHFERKPQEKHINCVYANVVRSLGDIAEAARVDSTLCALFPNDPDLSASYLGDLNRLANAGDSSAYRRAMQILDEHQRGTGYNFPTEIRKISLFLAVKDSAAMKDEIVKLQALRPEKCEYLLSTAILYEVLDKPDSSLAYINRACELDPANTMAARMRIGMFQERGDTIAYENALRDFLSTPEYDPSEKTTLFTEYASKVFSDSADNRREKALELCKIMIEQHPLEPQPHALAGSCLAMLGRDSLALDEFTYAVNLDPNNEEVWGYYISCAGRLGDNTKVEEAARRAQSFFPENHWFRLMETYALIGQDRYDEAELVADSALSLRTLDFSQRSQLLTTAADIRYKKNPTDSTAFAMYDEAIALDPSNVMAKNNLSYYLSEADRQLDYALLLAEDAVNAQPENPTFLDTYAWALFKNRKLEEAKTYIDKTLAAYEADPEANQESLAVTLEHAGDIYYMYGDPAKAREFWQRALKLDPDNDLLSRKVKTGAYLYE